jgi:diacylglycerol kinase (ATP)
MMRVLLIHNPAAGTADDSVTELIWSMRRMGYVVIDCPSKTDWRQALGQAPDVVAIAGGDGTVAEIARLMPTPTIPIGILPAGTANNIATSLGLTEIPMLDLVAGWPRAAHQPFDVGVARGAWGEFRFLESVGAGLLSDSIATINEGWASHVNEIDDQDRRIGAAFEVFRHTLRHMSASEFDVRVDGTELTGKYLVVEVMNFGVAGPNLILSQDADYSDGLLDVVIVPPDRRELLHQQLEQFRSDPARAPALPVHRGRHVQLRCDGCTLHLDDRLWRSAGSLAVEFTVDTGALTFLTFR